MEYKRGNCYSFLQCLGTAVPTGFGALSNVSCQDWGRICQVWLGTVGTWLELGRSLTLTSGHSSSLFVPLGWPEDHELEELDSSGVTACYDELMALETSNNEEDELSGNNLSCNDPVFDHQDSNMPPLPVNSGPLPINIPLVHPICDPHEPDENSPNPFLIALPHPTCTPYSRMHPSVPIRILYLIVVWLHSYHHVAFWVIRAILAVV